jgi:universal stress protein F
MFHRLLITLDLAHEEQLPRLVQTAQRLLGEDPGSIHLLYVDQSLVHQGSFPLLDESTIEEHARESQQRLQALLEQWVPEPLRGGCRVRHGTAYDQILEESRRLRPDAILMMSKRPGLSSYFIGANAEKVVRHADCSVFVIRA